MHKFNPENFKRLDSYDRRKKLPPDVITARLEINEGDSIVDIGCGLGYFTIPLSDRTGPRGKVYAVDISAEMLDMLKNNINGRKNIVPVLSKENEIPLPEKTADLVFMSFVLHETSDVERFTSTILALLKKSGHAAVIDWQKKETESGPPVSERMDKKDVILLFEKKGMDFTEEVFLHSDVYFLKFHENGC